ncbi:WD40-repeat-containing domain protein [Lentinula detonsa]|uniref:WD40-repeat-containing domain protein n=1 Tax=Lentinula detonsa TaxID=2804962 RepID=A0A9W8PD34_9AGAR|nr:WD40-repeat-containing domain protein [Lentinula detonsa]
MIFAVTGLNSSILCLAANDQYIFSGNQDNDILVWDKKTFEFKKATLQRHSRTVLALVYAEDKQWLLSSSGDSIVRVWSTITLKPVYIIDTHAETCAGDLYSIAWCPTLQTIYIGCQNTSLQRYRFTPVVSASDSGTTTPNGTVVRKAHKFFDSYPQFERRPADLNANNPQTPNPYLSPEVPRLEVPSTNVIESEHFGYIYCMTVLDEREFGVTLATGSGDETVKVWRCTTLGPSLVHTFECNYGAVLALVAHGEMVYGGCQDGHIKIMDLETKTLVRSIIVQKGIDILNLSLIDSDLYASSANGQVKRFSGSFDCTASWRARTMGSNLIPLIDRISYALSKFVSIPSVSCYLTHREDCRQAAIWLKNTQLLPTSESGSTIPLVLGTFTGNQGPSNRPRLLFYGHYDVIPAPPEEWNSDPFTLDGRNGYLYGRGVTDYKGPIIAIAFAAAELLYRRSLAVDVVFLVEGQEECGSINFSSGNTDLALKSNSTWISEDTPCITYGLRGVIHCSIEICNKLPDSHSGVNGGGVAEPMKDMINLLSMLMDKQQRIQIPGFYDHVWPQIEAEKELYSQLATITQKPASYMASRWREPALTIHNVEVSGPNNSTVIPGTVNSQISLRIVPDQN